MPSVANGRVEKHDKEPRKSTKASEQGRVFFFPTSYVETLRVTSIEQHGPLQGFYQDHILPVSNIIFEAKMFTFYQIWVYMGPTYERVLW